MQLGAQQYNSRGFVDSVRKPLIGRCGEVTFNNWYMQFGMRFSRRCQCGELAILDREVKIIVNTCMDHPPGWKKGERWPLVEVQL